MRNALRRQRARLMHIGYIRNFSSLRRNARLFLVSVVLNGLGFSIFMLFLNLYVLSLGESRQFLGLLQSVPSAVALILGIPAGILGDRLGRRRAMLVGGGTGVLAVTVFLISPSRPLMLFWAAVQGAATTLYWLNVAPFLTQNSTDQDRAFLFSADWSLTTIFFKDAERTPAAGRLSV